MESIIIEMGIMIDDAFHIIMTSVYADNFLISFMENNEVEAFIWHLKWV